jgi:hypothetical protein
VFFWLLYDNGVLSLGKEIGILMRGCIFSVEMLGVKYGLGMRVGCACGRSDNVRDRGWGRRVNVVICGR